MIDHDQQCQCSGLGVVAEEDLWNERQRINQRQNRRCVTEVPVTTVRGGNGSGTRSARSVSSKAG